MSAINFSGWKTLAFMIAGLVVFGLYLYFFVGIDELVYSIQRLNTAGYLVFFSLAIVSMILALFFWTAAWRTILRTLTVELALKKAFMIFLVGYFLDLVVPSETIGSELTRMYLVRNETNGDMGAIAASAITNRVVEYSIVTVGLFGSVLVLLSLGKVPSLVTDFLTLVLIGVIVYLAVLLLLVLNERAARLVVSTGIKLLKSLRIKRYSSPDAVEKAQASLAVFFRGFHTFRKKPRQLLKPLIFQLLSLLFNLAVYVFVFEALALDSPSFGFFLLLFFIASAIQGATASLSVGSLDIILVTVLTLYGFPAAESGIAVIVLRAATYWFPLLISYVMVQLYGVGRLLSSPRGNTNSKLNTEIAADSPIPSDKFMVKT